MPVPDCWRPNGAHPASCSAFEPHPGANRRLSPTKVAPGFDHTRSALGASLVPDGAPKRAMRRTPGRSSPRLARSTTDTGFPGARFWGQVRGSSGRLRIVQGKGGTRGETTQIAGKARYQAPFPGYIAAGRILTKRGATPAPSRQGSSGKAVGSRLASPNYRRLVDDLGGSGRSKHEPAGCLSIERSSLGAEIRRATRRAHPLT